jgi:general secretion pathway protein C
MGSLNDNRRMLARLCAFVIWALVAATAVFWGLRLLVTAPRAPQNTVAVGDPTTLRGDLARLLGSAPVEAVATAEVAAPEAAARFRLIGVMASRSAAASAATGSGVALIAVDGKAPQAYAVGSRVEEGVTLQSVGLRAASIAMGPGQPAVRLELAPLPPPATGTLPPPVMSQDAGAAAQPGAMPAPPPPMPPLPGLPGRPMSR